MALSVEYTAYDVITTVLDLENDLTEKIFSPDRSERDQSESDRAAIQAIHRLFPAMRRTDRSEYLRKNIMREVIYYILWDSCGKQLLTSTINLDQADEIYKVNHWIKENFRSLFSVKDLAVQGSMSISLFHQKFKSAVGMGPLQCQKRLRLTEARRLMLDENKNVTEASAEVGYESLSQFIRDYRKMFGRPPKEDIQNLQTLLEKQAFFSEK